MAFFYTHSYAVTLKQFLYMVLSVLLLTVQVTTIALHTCGFKPTLKVTEKHISDFLP